MAPDYKELFLTTLASIAALLMGMVCTYKKQWGERMKVNNERWQKSLKSWYKIRNFESGYSEENQHSY